MGVIYHQRNPFDAVGTLAHMLASGGTLLLESLIVPSSEPTLLIPRERYAKMRNAWSIPSLGALEALALRAGLEVEAAVSFGPLSLSEQRRTALAPYESLIDFLDPSDHSKTIEGYPAPHTGLVVARKPSR
jgi:tRNA (mo5U34)-methyltransferase